MYSAIFVSSEISCINSWKLLFVSRIFSPTISLESLLFDSFNPSFFFCMPIFATFSLQVFTNNSIATFVLLPQGMIISEYFIVGLIKSAYPDFAYCKYCHTQNSNVRPLSFISLNTICFLLENYLVCLDVHRHRCAQKLSNPKVLLFPY